MIQAELDRRFMLAVEQFSAAIARRGASDQAGGPNRGFSVNRVNPSKIQRTLEGAMARCRYVPHISVQLNDNWTFDPSVFATTMYCKDGSYCEFDYLGIDNGIIFVVDYRWGEQIDISMQAIPLKAIASIYVGYEAMIWKSNNERTSWSGNFPAVVPSVANERRVTQ